MATGNLVIFAGQSWLDGLSTRSSSAPDIPAVANAYQMTAATRSFAPFNVAGKWNAYVNGGVSGNSPVMKFATQWDARVNAGILSEPLFVVSVARSGSGFDLRYGVPGFTMWRADRLIGDGARGSSGAYLTPTPSGNFWPLGDSYSALDTLSQCAAAAKTEIAGMGLIPRLLGVCWVQGHADATVAAITQAEYYAYELSVKQAVESALAIPEAPWISVLVTGLGGTRPGAAAVNAAKRQMAEDFPLAKTLSLESALEYDPNDSLSYGGIEDSGGTGHLSDRGCWRMSEMLYAATIDSGFNGVYI